MLVVDFQKLQSAIDHMAEFGRTVTETLEDVEQAMTTLRATWHGSGSDAQAQSQQQWNEGAEQMKTALEQLQKVVTAAQKNYADAVTKNGAMWE